MARIHRALAGAVVAMLVMPSEALAAELTDGSTGSLLRIGISLVGLAVAAMLLIEAGRVRTVAWGGAIAERIDNVVLAIICLAASALARWTMNFVSGITAEQVQIAAETLVIVAMALLGLYFASVRRALHEFLKTMTGEEKLSDELRSASKETREGA